MTAASQTTRRGAGDRARLVLSALALTVAVAAAAAEHVVGTSAADGDRAQRIERIESAIREYKAQLEAERARYSEINEKLEQLRERLERARDQLQRLRESAKAGTTTDEDPND